MPTQLLDPPAAVAKALSKAGQKKVDELLRLRTETGRNWYQRAKVAAEFLADRAILKADFGDDEGRAADYIAELCFDDLCGMTKNDVQQLVAMYRDLDESVWQAHKYHVGRVEAAWIATKRPEPQARGPRASVTRKQLEEVEERAATAEYQVRIAQKAVEQEKQRAAELETKLATVAVTKEQRIRELELENAQLKGRIAELERQRAA